MAANTAPIFPLTPVCSPVTILPADTTTVKTLLTVGASGARVDSIHITSDDTAAMTVVFYVAIGGANYLLGQTPVPAGSGVANPWVEGLDSINAGNVLVLPAAAILKCAVSTTVTTAKTVTLTAFGGDF